MVRWWLGHGILGGIIAWFFIFVLCSVKSEQSAVAYKPGECMQELLKSWKEFDSSSQEAKNGEGLHSGPALEIRIPSEYVTSTNRQVDINFHFGAQKLPRFILALSEEFLYWQILVASCHYQIASI